MATKPEQQPKEPFGNAHTMSEQSKQVKEKQNDINSNNFINMQKIKTCEKYPSNADPYKAVKSTP